MPCKGNRAGGDGSCKHSIEPGSAYEVDDVVREPEWKICKSLVILLLQGLEVHLGTLLLRLHYVLLNVLPFEELNELGLIECYGAGLLTNR